MLVVEPRPEELERRKALLAEQGLRVVGVGRYEAAPPVCQALRPDAVLISVLGGDDAALRLARRVRHLTHGATPMLYVADRDDAEAHRLVLERGGSVDLAEAPEADADLLALRVFAMLRLAAGARRAAESDPELAAPGLRDPLTGASSRGYLLALLDHEMRRAERYGGSFSVVSAGLVNWGGQVKELGRPMAEKLLVYSAVVLGQTVRESDVVARVGQADFGLLLPGTGEEMLPQVVARLEQRFERARFQVEGRMVRVPVALGAVSFPDSIGTPLQLLTAAEAAQRRGRAPAAGGGTGAGRRELV